jgi:hypothetical protein
MSAFNTLFFPDVLAWSEVMAKESISSGSARM